MHQLQSIMGYDHTAMRTVRAGKLYKGMMFNRPLPTAGHVPRGRP